MNKGVVITVSSGDGTDQDYWSTYVSFEALKTATNLKTLEKIIDLIKQDIDHE